MNRSISAAALPPDSAPPPDAGSSPSAISHRVSGPPLLLPVIILAALTVTAAVLGAGMPRPGDSATAMLAYDAAHAPQLRIQAVLLIGSMFPLLVLAATLLQRWRILGLAAPGPVMGLVGGVLAAAGLVSSGMFGWIAAMLAPQGDAGLSKLLHLAMFASGAVGFVAPLGLLLAGTAIPGLITGLLPRALCWMALVIAVLAMASVLAVLTDGLWLLFPIGRFGGLLVLLAISALLPARAPGAQEAS